MRGAVLIERNERVYGVSGPQVEKDALFFVFPPPYVTDNHRLKTGNGKHYRVKEDVIYAKLIETECIRRTLKPTEQQVEVRIDWFPKDMRRDVTGQWKTLFDAMQGYVYVNDRQIKKYSVTRHDIEKGRERIEVWVKLYVKYATATELSPMNLKTGTSL